MNRVIGGGFVALVAQYVLMHSHKVGQLHWIWVAGGSLALFIAGLVSLQRIPASSSSPGRSIVGIAAAVSCVVVPPAIYIVREWMTSRAGLLNSMSQGGVLFLATIVFASGGWLYACALWWGSKNLK